MGLSRFRCSSRTILFIFLIDLRNLAKKWFFTLLSVLYWQEYTDRRALLRLPPICCLASREGAEGRALLVLSMCLWLEVN
jgi:hypothetical protein